MEKLIKNLNFINARIIINDLFKYGMSRASFLSRYSFAVVCVLVAIGVDESFLRQQSEFTIAIMIFPCLVSAWFGGFGTGILATFLSVIITYYVILPEPYSFSLVKYSDLLWLAFLSINGIMISLISGSLYASRHRVEEVNARLDRTYKTLEAAEGRLRFLVDQMPAVIWTTDRGLNIKSIFGGGQVLGASSFKKLGDFFLSDEEKETGFSAHYKALRGENVRYESHIFDRAFISQVQPLREVSSPEIVGVIGLAIDITERKRIQEDLEKARIAAESANQAKSQFLANISHEMRTPLGVVAGYADLALKSEYAGEQLQKWLVIIQRNAHQLNAIINDLLDLSKAEGGHLEIEELQVHFDDFIDDVASTLEFQANAKNIGFEIFTITKVPHLILTDPTRLRQILLNIVGNAIKFTDTGKVSVIVSLEYDQDNERRILRFLIKDTGIGLSEQQKERLFTPFMQADNTMARRFGGSGLGLALSRRLARLLGGDVVLVDSALGRGSKFEVTVKVAVPAVFNVMDQLQSDS